MLWGVNPKGAVTGPYSDADGFHLSAAVGAAEQNAQQANGIWELLRLQAGSPLLNASCGYRRLQQFRECICSPVLSCLAPRMPSWLLRVGMITKKYCRCTVQAAKSRDGEGCEAPWLNCERGNRGTVQPA